MNKRINSFKYAINGIIHCYSQPNMLIHGLASVFAILLGIIVKLSLTEWGIIILTIGVVTAAEAFNTSLENLVDLVSPGENEKAGMAKDIAAGAVLITAVMAVAAACFIFLPKIIEIVG